jgi:hypothetical protein
MPLEARYSQERLNRVRREAIREAASRPEKGAMPGGDGVLLRRIPREAYFNAVVNHGVSPQDEGYWADMERLYPECKVAYTPRGVRVDMSNGRQVARAPRLTRFGRVTWHKRYGPEN